MRRPGLRFCPRCGGWRRFRLNPLGGWAVCPLCGWRTGSPDGASVPEEPGEGADLLAAFTPHERAWLGFVRWEYQRGKR